MSLNGLDDPKVKEAHDAAVAEAGGWFLLKYASRDELELLGRGTGGIIEIRNAVAQYEETSPLYGFLKYRRRNVIIKYLPEDCSRLIQARATVHFNSICEYLSPYDTALSISDPKELRDTKLSAACSLHAASGSTSSSTSSLRRRRLVEIEEEEEEEERDRKRQSVVKEEDASNLPAGGKQVETSTPAEQPVTLNADLASSPEASKFVDETEVPRFIGVTRPPSPETSYDESGRRLSSQSARPDLYGGSGYPYGKPRVKLAPRPSADIAGRPRTSAGGATFRPVSALPAGLKLSKTPKKGRPDQGDDLLESPIKEEMETPFSVNSPPSPGPKMLDTEPARPHTSSGASILVSRSPSFRSNLPAMPPPANKQNTMTPEKQRLLKAMKLREKKKMMSSQPTLDVPSLELPSSTSVSDEAAEMETPADDEEAEGPNNNLMISLDSLSKADSAVGFDSVTDQGSIDARTDSHPASPFAPSDAGSTQASSLSESTDETIQVTDKPTSPPPTNNDDSDADADTAPSAPEERSPLQPDDAAVSEGEASSLEEQPRELEAVPEPEEEKALEDESREEVAENEPALEAAQTEEPPAPSALPVSKFSAPSAPAKTPPAETEDQPIIAQLTAEPEESSRLEGDPPAPSTPEADRPSEIRVPVSKFSTHDTKSPTITPSATIPTIVSPEPDNEGEPLSTEKTEDVAEDAPLNTKHTKLRAPLGPLKVSPNAEKDRYSVASLTDDGNLMEMQTATVEQAKPIVVLKSPSLQTKNSVGKLAAPGSESGSLSPRIVRTVSNPIRGPMVVPGDVSTSSARAVSSGAAYLHKITQQQSSAELRPKTGKIGSSISQRIKALEKLSSTTGGPAEPAPKDKPAAAFFAVRRAAGRDPSRSPSVADRANSLTRATTPSPPESGESSPESIKGSLRDRKGSMVSRLSVFEGGQAPRGRPESIQVTARIIRDPTHLFPKAPELKTDPTDYQPLDLKQSPLLVNVQNRTPSPNPSPQQSAAPIPPVQEAQLEAKQSLLQRRFSKGRRSESRDRNIDGASDVETVYDGPRPRRRSSLTVVRDFIKDRRDSLLGARSPSTDSLGLTIASGLGGLASPAIPTPSKSPSRPPSVHQTNIFTRRLSMSSRRSSMEQTSSPAALSSINLATAGLSPSPRITEGSGDSDADRRSINGYGEKMSGSVSGGSAAGSVTTSPPPGKNNTNRASRFMRRLSNSLSSSRKNITPSISPTVAEEEDAEVAAAADMGVAQSRGSTATGAPTYGQPTIVSYMGDVNVQFPDNLLWKRRSMCLDSQGFLILSAVQGGAASASLGKTGHHQAGAIKRYHMSDFRLPYTPEMEVQELPNSVVLDFVDGSGLQIACEDRAGQMNVLQVLQVAHHSHTSFGQ